MISVKEWAMAKILQEQGLSKTEIARRLGIDRKTVGRALQREEVPVYPTGSLTDSETLSERTSSLPRLRS